MSAIMKLVSALLTWRHSTSVNFITTQIIITRTARLGTPSASSQLSCDWPESSSPAAALLDSASATASSSSASSSSLASLAEDEYVAAMLSRRNPVLTSAISSQLTPP